MLAPSLGGVGVRYDNPLKQGLKHIILAERPQLSIVRYDNPLKQGLKR